MIAVTKGRVTLEIEGNRVCLKLPGVLSTEISSVDFSCKVFFSRELLVQIAEAAEELKRNGALA